MWKLAGRVATQSDTRLIPPTAPRFQVVKEQGANIAPLQVDQS